MESLMHPIQGLSAEGRAGTISAIGIPRRVTLTGRPFFPTSARTARQVALNREMVISVMITCTMVNDYGQLGVV